MLKRLDDPERIDAPAVAAAVESGDRLIVQYSKPVYTPGLLREIDALCAEHGDRVEVRFYGHGHEGFDLAHLRHLPSIRALTIDCVQRVTNEEVLRELPGLTRLGLGVFELDRPDVLAAENLRALVAITIGETRKRNVDLSPVSGMEKLAEVTIAGQWRGISGLTRLGELRHLRLSRLPKSVRLAFVGAIRPLRHLTLLLGGREDVAEARHGDLASLEIIRVRGLRELDPSDFPRLETLAVEDQIRLRSLELSAANGRLRRLVLVNCKGLTSVSGLAKLPALAELRILRTALRLDDVLAAGLPRSLRTVVFSTGKATVDREIEKQLEARGLAPARSG